MNSLEALLEQITNNLDERRLEFTNLRRVVLDYEGKPLEPTVVRMGIPIIYANWEGYVKEICQLYLEYIETTVSRCNYLQPAILGYLWTPLLRPISGGFNHERSKSVAEHALFKLLEPVSFSSNEKAIDTKSNLKYSVLKEICTCLCLDITTLTRWEKHINALVNLRNNISHGVPPEKLMYSEFCSYIHQTLEIMEAFEHVIISALSSKAFCRF